MLIAIVAEKPSQARNFGTALGGMKGTYNGEQYEITNVRGHLYEHKEPNEMVGAALSEKYKSWDPANLPWDVADFDWSRKQRPDVGSVISSLKATLTRADLIICATDLDPTGEGDLLFWEAIDELGFNSKGKKFARMEFLDESPASIQKAFVNRRAVTSMESEGAFRKALYRQKFDFTSIQFTRVASQMAMESGQRMVLRQGRLKSAMTKLVGDQLKAYDDYVKKPFFQNRFKDENNVMYTNPDEPTFDTKGAVPNQYTVSGVTLDGKAMKRTAPPKLLDLASLASMLVGKGVKAKETLSTYQKMYEHSTPWGGGSAVSGGVVSYPRTEDKTITPEQFKDLAPLIDQIAAVVGVDVKHLTHRQPRTSHVKPKGAHGANRPGPNVPPSLDAVEQKFGKAGRLIYEALAKNYLAMIAEDYEYEQQKGHVEKYPDFTGIANVPKSMGWKLVFNADADEVDEDESANGLGNNADPIVFEGANKRPEHPSMKWLMKQLEKRDVGTGATRTSTYSEVTSGTAKYPLLVEKGTKLTLADAGRMSWLLLPDTRIGDLGLTEKIYADMKAISEGKADADELLAQVADWVREDIVTMERNADAMRTSLGLQKKSVVQKERAEGTWSQTGKPVAFSRVWGGYRFSDEDVQNLLDGNVISFEGTSTDGKKFDVYGKLANGTFQGRKFIGFQKLGFGKVDAQGNAVLPGQFLGHQFTDAEKKALLAGEKISVAGLVGKSGKPFTGDLQWGEAKPGEGKKIIMTFGLRKVFLQHKFTDAETQDLLDGKKVVASDLVGKSGKTFTGILEWKEEKKGAGKTLVMSFENGGGGKPGELPKSWCEHTFTADEVKLLKAGKTIEVKGFVSKAGKKFDAKIAWKTEGGRKKIVLVRN